MTRYVVAIVVDDQNRVLLIQKKRGPASVIGKWNGPGGKVEDGEDLYDAVFRELREECGIAAVVASHRITLQGAPDPETGVDTWSVDFFLIDLTAAHMDTAHAQTDEPVGIFHMSAALTTVEIVPNLRWIIPFCINPTVLTPITVYDEP